MMLWGKCILCWWDQGIWALFGFWKEKNHKHLHSLQLFVIHLSEIFRAFEKKLLTKLWKCGTVIDGHTTPSWGMYKHPHGKFRLDNEIFRIISTDTTISERLSECFEFLCFIIQDNNTFVKSFFVSVPILNQSWDNSYEKWLDCFISNLSSSSVPMNIFVHTACAVCTKKWFGGATRIRTGGQGVAVPCLTTWL